MSHGFVDLKVRRDIPRVAAALLAINQHASEFSIGCRPLEVQLLKHQRCAYVRVFLLVDAADMEWVVKTGWVHAYTAKHREAHELFFMPWPKCTGLGAVARALHTAEVLGAMLSWFGFHNTIPKEISVTWRPATLASFHAFLTGENTDWIRPLTEEQREGLFKHAETLKEHLESAPPAAAATSAPVTTGAHKFLAEFPALGKSPSAGSPNALQPLHINEEDQARLHQVAFLGADKNFAAPEALWLKGPSPIELRASCGRRALSWKDVAS